MDGRDVVLVELEVDMVLAKRVGREKLRRRRRRRGSMCFERKWEVGAIQWRRREWSERRVSSIHDVYVVRLGVGFSPATSLLSRRLSWS